MTSIRVRCGDCGAPLPESAATEPVDVRGPCPVCGGTSRAIELGLLEEVNVAGSISWMKTRETVVRHWPWILATLALTLLGSGVGLVLGGWSGAVVGLLLGLVGIPVGARAATRLREIERGP